MKKFLLIGAFVLSATSFAYTPQPGSGPGPVLITPSMSAYYYHCNPTYGYCNGYYSPNDYYPEYMPMYGGMMGGYYNGMMGEPVIYGHARQPHPVVNMTTELRKKIDNYTLDIKQKELDLRREMLGDSVDWTKVDKLNKELAESKANLQTELMKNHYEAVNMTATPQ